MRIRTVSISIVVALLLLALALTVSAGITGNLEPPGPPDSTYSYTLEDIYDRLDAGTEGAPSTFTEPSSVPGAGTMHTLNDIMAEAPTVDNTTGALPGEVLAGRTYWSLRTDGTWGTWAGSRYPAPVPKTGQTGCWDESNCPIDCAGTGQDGDYQKGVAWPSPRFITGTMGVVTDTLTGLVWLENANCTKFFLGDSTGENQRSWGNALTAANSLEDGYCGLTDGSSEGDWRLPNLRELQTLIDYGEYWPALPDGHPFTGVQSDYYWSSTTIAGNAWFVCLQFGPVSYGSKTNADYVWPVRGGP